MVDNSDLGERLAGVSIRRVRAVSIGLRRIDESIEEAVAIHKLAIGAVHVSMELFDRAPVADGLKTSTSCIPRTAAKNDRKKASTVR